MIRCGSSGCAGCGGGAASAARLQRRHLAGDAVRPERGEELELAAARGVGAAVGEVDDLALGRPSIAACGSSTKLVSPSESQ